MKKTLKILGICLLCIIMIGCQGVGDKAFNKLGYQKIDQANQEIQAVRKDAQDQIEANNQKIEAEKNDISNIDHEKEQNASNLLFNAEFAITTLPTPLNRTDLVVDTNIKSASAFLPPPTNDAIQNALVEVKKELNETLTTNADLTKKLQDAQIQAQILSAQQKTAQDVILTLKTSNDQIVSTTNKTVDSLQNQKDAVTKNLLSSQQQALDNADNKKALEMKLMWGTGIISVLCIAAAIWLPVFKRQSIEGAALFSFITLSIPYIQPWMLLVAGAIFLIVILGEIGFQHNTAVNALATATNTSKQDVVKAVVSNAASTILPDPPSK
jgi:hypothetical protein